LRCTFWDPSRAQERSPGLDAGHAPAESNCTSLAPSAGALMQNASPVFLLRARNLGPENGFRDEPAQPHPARTASSAVPNWREASPSAHKGKIACRSNSNLYL